VLPTNIQAISEGNEEFAQHIISKKATKVRSFSLMDASLLKTLSEAACYTYMAPILLNGRIELLRYLREVCLSRDYHRYGYLGEREGEVRHILNENCCASTCHCITSIGN
jgi:RHH-type proline utilization regulon transcriptional repressor/proline dehydrogenase/delta 1-pyrroline-5-carboxylate dehydrogenase